MKIYDISQEVFGCQVYPGDPAPERRVLCSTEKGDLYNSICAHTTARTWMRLFIFCKAEKQ